MIISSLSSHFFENCPWHWYEKRWFRRSLFNFSLLLLSLLFYYHLYETFPYREKSLWKNTACYCSADIYIRYTRHRKHLVPRIVLISLKSSHWMLLTRKKTPIVWFGNNVILYARVYYIYRIPIGHSRCEKFQDIIGRRCTRAYRQCNNCIQI